MHTNKGCFICSVLLTKRFYCSGFCELVQQGWGEGGGSSVLFVELIEVIWLGLQDPDCLPHKSGPWVADALQFSRASIPMVSHCSLVQTKLFYKTEAAWLRKASAWSDLVLLLLHATGERVTPNSRNGHRLTPLWGNGRVTLQEICRMGGLLQVSLEKPTILWWLEQQLIDSV